ncbi:MAG: DUF3597 domain-containing protein [Pseudomonadota bacterium]|nr:DUF3597 domain-containing protein [Pseudomonadota bacterium]
MGILSNIFSKIFPASHAANSPAPPAGSPSSTATTAAPAATPAAGAMPAAAPTALSEVDVEKLLDEKAKATGQPLNWRTSIVDLMKLLELDSSLNARKELAQELHYTGDTSDTANMNIWLHRQVMNKVAANGGKVPADLRD